MPKSCTGRIHSEGKNGYLTVSLRVINLVQFTIRPLQGIHGLGEPRREPPQHAPVAVRVRVAAARRLQTLEQRGPDPREVLLNDAPEGPRRSPTSGSRRL